MGISMSDEEWNRYFTSLDYKANTDADNFTNLGDKNLCSKATISDKYIDLPHSQDVSADHLSNPQYTFVAPEDGYLYLGGNNTRSYRSPILKNETKKIYCGHRSSSFNVNTGVLLPLNKGETGGIICGQNDYRYRFYYLKGNKPLT